ncbi:DNRLRE domain-containing protein [Streptomyces roseolilacinus]|uniref:DNRLRE domain-containing protein n=1 Tax=Streptomyces roseolilacinus TaxID=66904 RepID=UPI001E2BAA30|nr:DNRLRE domain-containing protein [Streptomyces roseolilacinus]
MLSAARLRYAALAAAVVMSVSAVDAGVAVATAPRAASGTAQAAKPLGPAEAADAPTAMLLARLQQRRIEITGERTESTTTWAGPDGTTTVEAFTGAVRVKDAQGVWRPVDMTLVDAGEGVRPRRAAADVTLSDGGTGEPLARVGRGGQALGVGWEGKLPAPRLDGPTATYPNAVEGGDLVVTALREGFQHNVVLRERPTGPVEYRLPVAATGLSLKEAGDKRLLWHDAKGRTKAAAPAPVMWDSSRDKASGEPERIAGVEVEVERDADGKGQVLVLRPSAAFLADPSVTYPVTIDPTDSLMGPVTDTWIQYDDYLTTQRGSTELKTGTYDGSEKARSFLKFNVAKYAGKQVLDAKLRLYSFYSSTCDTDNAGVEVRRITESWDSAAIGWADQPATTTSGAVVVKDAKGYSAACPAGYSTWDIDAIAQAWAGGQPNHGVRLAGAGGETDPLTWRRYRSANHVDGSHDATHEPSLTVQYNSTPGTVTPLSPLTGTATRDTTPTLSGKATDADGNMVQLAFEVWKSDGTAALQSGTAAKVNSGATASWTAGTALAQGAYKWRARASDGTATGSWSAWQTFTVDTTKPAATAVSSADFPAGQWSGTADGNGDFTGAFTFTPPATDTKSVQYQLDGGTWTTVSTTGAAVTRSLTFKAGEHTLTARTRDAAGNLSANTVYAFSAGKGAAITSPADGDRPARRVVLTSEGRGTYTGVRYQYRHGEADAWKDVPVADVRRSADGSAVTAWPFAVTGGKPASLYWNVTSTLPNDGPVEIRAVFTAGTTTDASPEVEVTVDRNAGEAPTAQVGPGSLNLLTGDFKIGAKDVEAFEVSVNRTFSSRANPSDTEGQAAVFGPGWVSSVSAQTSGSGYTQLRRTSATSVEILDADGDSTAFTATANGGWEPETGAGTLTLTGSLTGDAFTLKDTDATVSVFRKVGAGATTWTLATSAAAVEDSTVTVVSETVVQGGQTVARPKYLISPSESVAAATCQAAPSTRGCRVLEFVYATATTATGWSTAADFGDFAGQVKAIKLWAADPGAAATRDETLASYRYDAYGRLRQQWNPHYSQGTQVQYSYDAAGRVFWMMAGPEQAWNFHYGKAGSSLTSGDGMLLKVTRPTLKQGTVDTVESTATTTVVYDVPLTGTKAPYQMGAAEVGAWAQDEVPTDATAVFPADSVPASSTGADLTATGYGRAAVTYVDANGRETNTARPGGDLDVTEFDRYGNTVGQLSAANRALAMGTAPDAAARLDALDLAGLTTAERAERLSSATVYSEDGQRVTDTYGPLHQVTLTGPLAASGGNPALAAGTSVPARQHTAYRYDEGRPADAAVSGMSTSTSTGAAVEGYAQDADVKRTATTYNWATGEELVTRDDQGTQLSATRSAFRADGKLASTSLPMSNGADAGTLTYTYWTAAGTGECAGRPEWAGLLCKTAPAGAVTGGGDNPAQLVTSRHEYNRWGGVTKTTETANGVTRVLTVTYDDAARRTKSELTGGTGTATAATTYTFDPNTARLLTQSSGGKTVTYAYDSLGRQISYQDGSGNTTKTEYDLLDRPVKTSDSTGASTVYGYDAQGDLGTVTDSVAGAFTADYGAGGTLVSQSLPGGHTLRVTTDPLGRSTARVYTDAEGATVLADVAEYDITGRLVGHTQTDGTTVSTDYGYDAIGRLSRAADSAVEGCAVRAYAFDGNRNRKTRTVTRDDCDPATQDAVVDQTAYAYDSADRLTGRAYDAFGRTTAKDGVQYGYYAGDGLRTETVGDRRRTWDLDAAGRPAVATTETRGADGAWTVAGTVTQHYGDESTSPDWEARGDGTVTRFVNDAVGSLTATTTGTGVVLQLTNLAGDVAVRLDLADPSASAVQRYDEFGAPAEGTGATRYGWQGGSQVSSDTLSGVVLTNARAYEPGTGRFLQVDPQYDGGANAYVYCGGDPVGCRDLSGEASYYRYYDLGRTGASATKVFSYWKKHFKAIFPIPGRPNKITHEGQKFTLHPKVYGIRMDFPVKVNSIGKSYLQLGARRGHPDWPGGWIGFDLYKKKGRMKLEVRGKLGGAAAIFCGRSCSEAKAKPYWDKLGKNLRKVVRDKF